jgi:hypothetical protein
MTHHDTDDMQLRVVDEGGTAHIDQHFPEPVMDDEQRASVAQALNDPIWKDETFHRLCAAEAEANRAYERAVTERIEYARAFEPKSVNRHLVLHGPDD